jgi:hypothetical protein
MDEGLNTFSTGRTIDQVYKSSFLSGGKLAGSSLPSSGTSRSRETDQDGLEGVP